jgi:glycosyltransferase involved in cell wall biosynthesis
MPRTGGRSLEAPSGVLITVSVVMSTYNRRAHLERVLVPLLSDDRVDEVVVVIDGSTDGSTALLDALAEKEARLRPITIENRGMGPARRVGIEAAQGELVLLLDDDVLVEPGTVSGHARHHEQNKGLVVLGAMPVVDPAQRDAQDYARTIYANEYRRHTQRWLSQPETILRTLWEGHLSVRRADLLRLEPPAEIEKLGYHADIDLGLRCERAGLRAVFDPSLRGEHLFTRTPAAFLRSAHQSGMGRARLHRVYPEMLGPLPSDFAMAGLSVPERALVRAARRSQWPDRGLSTLVARLGEARLFRLQRRAAALRWSIAQERGARMAEAASAD